MRFFSEPQQPLGLVGALTLFANVTPALAAPSSSSDNDYVGVVIIISFLIVIVACLFPCMNNSGSCYQDPAFVDHGESAHGGDMLDVLHDVEAPVVHPEVETSGNMMHIVEFRYKPQ